MRLYSAVVDPHGVFPIQAERLVKSLVGVAGVDPDNIVLHLVREAPISIYRSLSRLGVEIVEIERFQGFPYLNKLNQFNSLEGRGFQDVVLMDCDVIVLESPPKSEGKIHAKAVDFQNPPIEILKSIFENAQLPFRDWKTDIDYLPNVWANCNGGIYIVDGKLFSTLAKAWKTWANWCVYNIELFKNYYVHIDQVSFAMAIASEQLPFEPLHFKYNFPTHVPQDNSRDCSPAVIHYHRFTDEAQLLSTTANLPQVNKVISNYNNYLTCEWRSDFDNTTFWNARYSQHPSLGSGLGSRGEFLSKKRELIDSVVNILNPNNIADVGCGDGSATVQIPQKISVVGHDVAPSSSKLYCEARSNNSWKIHDIRNEGLLKGDWDLVICLDVLIHLAKREEYLSSFENLISAECPVLVSGYEATPVISGPMTFFHEPLSVTIQRFDHIGIPISGYRNLVMYLAIPKTYFEKLNLKFDLFQIGIPYFETPLLTLYCLLESNRTLGFFPNHLPRYIEYAWILEQLKDSSNLRIIEAGAGVNILPIILSKMGNQVITIDSHNLIRDFERREDWNEWGFLDYSQIDENISSFNASYEDSCFHEVDVVMSVSVIEHLSKEIRLRWLAKAKSQLKNNGLLLLTVDIIPFTRNLWNFSEGEKVESIEEHGAIHDLINEINSAGFEIVRKDLVDYLPQSRVGILKLAARKVGSGS